MTMQHRGDLILSAIVLLIAYFALLWTLTGALANMRPPRPFVGRAPMPAPAPPALTGQTIRMTIVAPRVPLDTWNQRQFARSR